MNRALVTRRRIFDNIVVVVAIAMTGIALAWLFAILWGLVAHGVSAISLRMFTLSTAPPGSEGGLLNAIVGSLMMDFIAMAGAVPIGLLAGTYLSEYGRDSKLAEAVRFVNDILLSAPSILIGLFVYAIAIAPASHFSAWAGSLALMIIAVPILVRTTENMLRLVPDQMREAATAIGAPKWKVTLSVVQRAAFQGLLTGGLLALARVSGETAPLLFTAFGNQFLSYDMSRPMASLPQVIFQFANSSYPDWQSLAWGGAFLITMTVLLLNIISRLFAPGKGTRLIMTTLEQNSPVGRITAAKSGEMTHTAPPKVMIKDLHFSYGKGDALRNISLNLQDKMTTAFIGPSGCGKSTLLRTLNRIYDLYPGQQARGEIVMDGRNILDPRLDLAWLRSKVGMVFQKPTPFPMPIYENIAFGVRLYEKLSRADMDERVEWALRKAALWNEVSDKLQQPGTSLSGGQQQRLCIARAIAVRPEVLLMDEPTSALDPISTSFVEDLINELSSDYCIAIVTHNMQQAARVSNFTAFMYLGELVEFETTEKMFTSPRDQRTNDYITGRFG